MDVLGYLFLGETIYSMTVHLLQICQDIRTGDYVVAQPSGSKKRKKQQLRITLVWRNIYKMRKNRKFKVAKVHDCLSCATRQKIS